MLVFATQITPVVLRVMFSCEFSLRNLACCGCCHHTHLHCCVKPSRPQTKKEVCSVPQCPLGEAVTPLFAFGAVRCFP